ncbi:arginine methyl transferase [Mycena filopes]|nr:arginine methyl transferase [Mycena filopes]
MSEPSEEDLDALTATGDTLINAILSEQPLESVKQLIASGAPLWFQNDLEGLSCLHAAAYTQNKELVRLLIEVTAGDIALSFNNEEIYTIIRDAGIRAELVLALLSSRGSSAASGSAMILRPIDDSAAASTDAFLCSKLRFTVDDHGQDTCMLNVDGEEIGVMMGWENIIMEETFKSLTAGRATDNLKILNIDTLFQSLSPAVHVIIEAHPDVLQHMRKQGWYEKPGVKILEGKWQDFINPETMSVVVPEGGFDLVYTDSFSEDYEALRGFFRHLPTLLGPGARFSFFNGLGATNATIYDVSTRLAECHLADAGFNVKWSDVDVREQRDRWGNSRPYFTCPLYRLPMVHNS